MESKDLFAPCGTYCGVCPWRFAYVNNDEKLKAKLANMVGIEPEDVVCEGCRSDHPLYFCQSCKIKECVQKKNIESCAECKQFPCKIIENFPFEQFIIRVKWDVAYRKKYGKDKWFEKTIKINKCPSCGMLYHWRSSFCKECNLPLPERYK